MEAKGPGARKAKKINATTKQNFTQRQLKAFVCTSFSKILLTENLRQKNKTKQKMKPNQTETELMKVKVRIEKA